jgi:hypothetical protein
VVFLIRMKGVMSCVSFEVLEAFEGSTCLADSYLLGRRFTQLDMSFVSTHES